MDQDFRKSPPTPLAAVPFNVPVAEKFTMPNGLRVVVIEDRRFPCISLKLGFRFGDINDPENGIGVNSAMASLMTEGTESNTSRELAEKIENLGAGLSVGSGFDNTTLSASSLASCFSEVADLIAEVLLRPTFPEKELALYVQNAVEGLKYQRSQPDFLADEQVASIIYGSHPYSINSPSVEQFESLSRDSLVAAYKKGIVPNNAVMVVVGDISAEETRSMLESRFSDWAQGVPPVSDFPEPPVRDRRTVTIVDRPGSTQTNLVLANPGIKRLNPDYFPVLLMNQVLGAGASSRLFMNLREEKGYTYGAYSRVYARRHAGSIEATSEVRSAVTGDALKEFFYELERIRTDLVSETELEDAKNFLAGVFPIRAETQNGLIGLVVSQQLSGLPDDYLDTYRDNVRSVTREDVQRAANKYIHPDQMAIIAVGDALEIHEHFAPYSDEIEVLDNHGKKKDLTKQTELKEGETVDISGNWAFLVDAQGQELPVSVVFTQTGSVLSGEMDSMLGNGKVTSGTVTGNRFSVVITSDFQGQEIELDLAGVANGDSIDGTITVPMMPTPLQFKGSRN